MKKILAFLFAIVICLSAFCGCTDTRYEEQGETTNDNGGTSKTDNTKINADPNDKIYTDYEGIYLTLKSVSENSITVTWHNETSREVLFGEAYDIEYYDADTGKWESVMVGEHIVPSEANIVMPNTEIEKTYSAGGFDLTKEGKYRLRCDFNSGSGTLCGTWVEFTVSPSTAGTRIWDSHHPDDGGERNPYFSVDKSPLGNVTIEYRADDNKIFVDGEYLLGGIGYGCESFYLSDLTGDGCPELCFCMNFGSGIVDKRIEIIDYTTKKSIFILSDRGCHDYYLFLRNGVLCVKETEYMKRDAVRTGVLVCNGSEITVSWDSEVNTTIDRDPAPAPGEPVH